MRELSLHLIDILQNSIKAGASLITVELDEFVKKDELRIVVIDNGCGISKEMLAIVKDPFVTSRQTRKVGLGLSLLEAACKRCDGFLEIESEEGNGTKVTAVMRYSHIDRAPIGRVEDTILSVLLYLSVDIVYTHKVDELEFKFDSREIKKIAGDDLSSPEILKWIKDYIKENIEQIGGGAW